MQIVNRSNQQRRNPADPYGAPMRPGVNPGMNGQRPVNPGMYQNTAMPQGNPGMYQGMPMPQGNPGMYQGMPMPQGNPGMYQGMSMPQGGPGTYGNPSENNIAYTGGEGANV